MSSNGTNTTAQADSGGSSFHTFPESKWVHFTSLLAPISVLGFCVFLCVHFRSDPYISGLRHWRRVVGAIIVCYVIPLGIIIGGSITDGATPGFMLASIVVETAINLCLFKNNTQHKIYSRFGSRILFVSMCVLIGASTATENYNSIDYYGPVRVTGVELEAYRPEQKIETVDPKYYYYYQIEKKIEWGDSWGCPATQDDRWCSTTEDLYKDDCRVRIDCDGHPNDSMNDSNGQGWCATEKEKARAEESLILCWVRVAHNEGLQFTDFMNTNFTKAVAPWDDSLNPHTVTRSVSCGACEARETIPPEQLASKALLYWISGGVLGLIGGALFAMGILKKEHHQVVFQRVSARVVFRPNPARAVFRPVAVGEISNDLELASNLPVAPAVHT